MADLEPDDGDRATAPPVVMMQSEAVDEVAALYSSMGAPEGPGDHDGGGRSNDAASTVSAGAGM